MDVNYRETLIAVADDCSVDTAIAPEPRAGKMTIAVLQFELLKAQPYELTSAELLFRASMLHNGLTAGEIKKRRRELWEEFFAKPQACLRASALPKKYGWGLHCDADAKVALCAVESPEYRRLLKDKAVKVVKAMRSKRV